MHIGIAVDSNGNVYVSDAEKCNIQKFDSEANFITMWGSEVREDGNLLSHGELRLIQMKISIQVIRLIPKFKNLITMTNF